MKFLVPVIGACAAPAVKSVVLIEITDTNGVFCAGVNIISDLYLIVKTFISKRFLTDTRLGVLCISQKSAMWTKQTLTISV